MNEQKSWKDHLAKIASNVDDTFDKLRYRLSDRLNSGRPVMILPYRGFGTREQIWLKGRVLEDNGLRGSTDNDSVWDNMLAAYRRVESDEIPNVRVTMRYDAHEMTVESDHEGYFEFLMEVPEGLPEGNLHHEVRLSLPDEVRGESGIEATGQVVVPPVASDFGIISDIDDTILQTNATNLLTAARLTFMENARTRKPFEGVAAFYRALQVGPEGRSANPIFFVSSGPWNLYDLLVEFMEQNDIPSGPIFLQDYGLEPDKLIHGEHLDHKITAIERVLQTYPELPFVLIGDSGQHDPEVYRAAVDRFPGRIRAIYIRDVTVDARDEEIAKIADELKSLDVPMVLVSDSRAAAEHAEEIGLIRKSEQKEIVEETEEELAMPEQPLTPEEEK